MNGGDAASLAAADFNHDGKMDLIITSQTGAVAVTTGLGNGQFTIPTAPLATFGANPSVEPIAEVADLNGDGYPDVVISSTNTIILLNSAGTLSAAPLVPEHNGAWLGDVNGDGYPDLIGSTGKVYLNDMHGGFGGRNHLVLPCIFEPAERRGGRFHRGR